MYVEDMIVYGIDPHSSRGPIFYESRVSDNSTNFEYVDEEWSEVGDL